VQTVEEIRAAYDAAAGQEFQADGRFAVSSCSFRDGRSGKFAVVDLRDPSGTLTARCFDEATIEALATVGAIDARLKVSAFNGTISAVIQRYQAADLSEEDVMRFAGLDVEAHNRRVTRIKEWLAETQNTVYGDVLNAVFEGEGVWDAFVRAPAAVRLHHAEPGGLVRHLIEVGEAGLGLLDSTGMPYDRAYFLAGVLLHDIGKLDTYTLPPTIQYSAQGQLVEHQIYSTVRVAKACASISAPASIEAKLIHIVEQAHGAYRHAEWQDPLGPEPKALAAADYFSSRLGVTDKERRSQEALDRLIADDSRIGSAELGSAPIPERASGVEGEIPLF
jgi:3'-5' exoribonuclease